MKIQNILEYFPAAIESSFAKTLKVASGCILLGLMIPRVFADTGSITGNLADAQVNSAAGVLSVSGVPGTYGRVGAQTNTQCGLVYVFQIPSTYLANPTQRFTTATFTVHSGIGSTDMPVNGDLYGLGYSTSPTVLASDFYEGSLDPDNTLIQDNFFTSSTPFSSNISVSNAALVDYLNTQLALARADSATTAYVFLRINPDAYVSGKSYVIAMADVANANAPTLAYTTAPVSNWSTVPLGGGGCVSGLITDPSGAAIYCRTDVGGAYRWNAASGSWISISDTMVPYATRNAGNLMGISSLAVDRNNPDVLYAACGRTTTGGLTGIYRSTDKGQTWTAIKSAVSSGGNTAGKSCGERLAVDPNNSNILWYGSFSEGLIKGVNNGGTWTWTAISSSLVPIGNANYGVSFVACDKNGSSTIVYAGVFDSTGGTGGVYGSTDGGASWTKIAGISLPTPWKGQVASNGTLYVTSGTAGVGKMLRSTPLSTASFTSISPVAAINYNGIAVAPNDPTGNTVYVSQCTNGAAPYGKIWRTTNGGGGWLQQSTNFNGGVLSPRTEPDGTLSCTAAWFASTQAILVNSTNSNELWVSDTYGVARSQNAHLIGGTTASTQPVWYTLQKGLEETVVATIKTTPTGAAKLMTGVADVGGFRYLDTTRRPYGTAGSAFPNPIGGNTTSLDFCESNSNIWIRAWDNPQASGGSGAVSNDNGVTWNVFGQVTSQNVTNSGAAAIVSWDVGTYLARQKALNKNIVTLVLASGSSISPLYSSATVSFDSKEGTVPPRLLVNGSVTVPITADSYVGNADTAANYGSANLQASYFSNTAPHSRWIYLKFDLSSVGSITSAQLQLNRQASANTLQTNIGVFACTNTTWTETGITWANKPAVIASTGDPISDPRMYIGPTMLTGGRVALSSTNANNMVWLPEGTSNVAYFSKDRGVTWAASLGGPTSQMANRFYPSCIISQLTADRVNGNFYLAKFGTAAGGNHAFYRSTDGGENWTNVTTINTSSYNVYRAQLVAAPVANDLWLSDDGVEDITKGGLWRSTNGGSNWTKISGLTAVSQVAFGAPLAGSGTAYTVIMNGYKDGVKAVWRSTNYGTSWTSLGTPTIEDILWLEGDRQTYGKVYIGTAGRGIFQGN